MKPQHRIAVFASGSGSNAEVIMKRFADHPRIQVALIVCNKPNAGVIDRAARFNVDVLMTDRNLLTSGNTTEELLKRKVGFIVLAGFLLKIPDNMLEAFPDSIVNIHPSLLPKFGGKGMYGDRVHEAVLDSGERVSGITIHLVNQHYDEGRILEQFRCEVTEHDTVQSLSERIHRLEHQHYAEVLENYLREHAAGPRTDR